jgi:NhaA family Na+:H+ antiporter
MATDIAFAIGILALLGDRVPVALKVFLTALAIVDDLGAVLVIALFYSSDLNLVALMGGFGFLAVMFVMNRAGVRNPLVYFVVAVGLWLCFLQSGVHATIAGVLAAMAIPARTLIDEDTYLARALFLVNACRRPDNDQEMGGHHEKVRMLAQNMETASENVQPPLHRLERLLHPWQSFFIMPVFALANAGVSIGHGLSEALTSPVTFGIVLGLMFGKQIGITLFSWGSVKLGWAALPRGVNWKQVYGVGWLGGIGFTMSLFVANLAFTDPDHLLMGKAGILCGSILSGVCGFILLRRWIRE